MEYYHDTWKLGIEPEKKLKVIVVGAGVAELSCGIGLKQSGHDVTIFEQVHQMAEVGECYQAGEKSTRSS